MPECETGDLLAKFLDGPMADVDEIVFAERIPGNDHGIRCAEFTPVSIHAMVASRSQA